MNIIIAGDFFISDDYANKKLIDQSVIDLFQQADYRIVNLESPITANDPKNKILKTGPHLHSSEDTAIPYLKQLHIDMATLANNHILDYGEQGLISTFRALDKNNIYRVGAGTNLIEASQPFTIEKEGLKIAILNFCENEWSIAQKNKPGANPLDIVSNFYQLNKAKSKADHVIVIIHGGHEHFQLPSPRMINLYRYFIDSGASAVIGHHTHCFSGFEIYKDSPIYYGLGNFIFTSHYKEKPTFFEGMVLLLNFNNKKLEGQIIPIKFERKTSRLRLMNQIELQNFNENLNNLNRIISDKTLIQNHFDKKINDSIKEYLSIFEPYSNRISKYLFYKNVLPRFVHKNKIKQLLGIIQNESHRDILIEVLKRSI